MSRLTYRGTPQMTEDGMITPTYSDYPTRRIIEKLAEYEDKQEQGLLIILPVAEGTEVWCIGSCGELCDNWSMECSDCKEHEIVFSTTFDRNMVEQWGKTVFATEVKAEEALARMKGE